MSGAKQKLLLLGASGSIGWAIHQKFVAQAWDVVGVTRNEVSESCQISWNPLDKTSAFPNEQGPFDAVCWAQGKNINDSIYSFNDEIHREMYEANVLYVLNSVNYLLKNNLLTKPSRLCVISSIWQEIARQNKLSYCVSKSALKGLILSLANDMGVDGHLVNAILPGALDTPMTHQNLSEKQLGAVLNSTQFGRLPSLQDVANAVYFLCSDENTGMTGQFIKVDLGYSDVRII
jgi:NAD(P)-dependent dehydrogenase (short-subunit alcohol dehydrogenase family)